jgi:hypothetical protein
LRVAVSALLYLFLDFLHPNGEYPEMNSEDFWTVFLIVLAAALLWIVFNVFGVTMNIGEILIWESTNALLSIPAVIGLVMLTRWIRGKPVFHRAGLAHSLRSSAGESSLTSPVAKIRGAMVRGRAYRLR